MPSRGESVSLADIAHNIELARRFVAGIGYEQFLNDAQVFYAATRCLEIVSEASRRLSPELKARHPNMPWAKIAGSGNIYRHDYEEVAHLQVWRTIHEFLPELRSVVVSELAALNDLPTPETKPRS